MKFFKKNILNFLILTLGFFIILLTLWITKTFGKNVYYVEILYIHIGYEGFKDSPNEYKISFLLYTIFPAFVLSIIFLFAGNKLEQIQNSNEDYKYLWLNKYIKIFKLVFLSKFIKIFLFNSYIFLVYCSLFFVFQFGFFEYFEKNARYEDYPELYKNPYLIKYNEPANQKNLILFYVESLEYDVSKLSNNDKSDPLEFFNKIKGEIFITLNMVHLLVLVLLEL